ncbi:MAG: DUF3052 domain-containing protein [Leptospira sp.]|nr:DUF3052 domain-containing protein [Leptospira sp.]
MAGYSKKTLRDKLGIKSGFVAIFIGAYGEYSDDLGALPDNVSIKKKLSGKFDFIHYFAKDKKKFEKDFRKLGESLNKTGMLWISWPKGSSGLQTDLNENIIRETGLKHGLVDIKVCAVNEVWSGLKFVIRKENR